MSQITLVSNNHGPITEEKWHQALTHAQDHIDSSALSLEDALDHLFSDIAPENGQELPNESTSCLRTLIDTISLKNVVLAKFPIPKTPSISRDMALSQSLLHVRVISFQVISNQMMTHPIKKSDIFGNLAIII
jgi:hypothetical protein